MIEGSQLVVTDGTLSIKHSGRIELKSVSKRLAEFEIEVKEGSPIVVPKKIEDYVRVWQSVPITSGGLLSVYHYFQRKKDKAYLVSIWRGYKHRNFKLGSINDSESRIGQLLQILPPQGKQFSRKDLYINLPKPLKHGQILKAVLDVLTKEEFLRKIEVENGTKEIYERTEKTIN